MNEKKTPRAAALLPIAVFLVLYLGLGIVLEYVLKVKMGFYQIPIVVAFLVVWVLASPANSCRSYSLFIISIPLSSSKYFHFPEGLKS